MRRDRHVVICGTDDAGNPCTVETIGAGIVKRESWPTVEQARNAARYMLDVYGADTLIDRFN